MKSNHYWREIRGIRESQGWEKGDFTLDGTFKEGFNGVRGGAWERISRKTDRASQADT